MASAQSKVEKRCLLLYAAAAGMVQRVSRKHSSVCGRPRAMQGSVHNW